MSAEYEFPEYLLEAQRSFYVQQEVISRLVAQEPSARLVAEGTAAVPRVRKDALAAARAKQGAAVDILYNFADKFWKDLDPPARRQVKEALEALVKKELGAAQLKAAADTAIDWEALNRPGKDNGNGNDAPSQA
ncbi:hypothetical protein [Nonomuraea jabiensis]|uniref:hypothetical protein n=1 Tax=Nonomuraea jabiensis TaxID=882448 RepID=UPI003D742742